MKILVCGSREYTDKWKVFRTLSNYAPSTLVVGGAKGPDTYAEIWYENIPHRECELIKIVPDYEKYPPRVAPLKRNDAMLDTKPDLVLAFWDGQSKGTKYTIDRANERGITVEVYYEPERESDSTD